MAPDTTCPTPGKVAYARQADAERHARALARNKGAPFVRAYRCDGCRQWHVGRSLGAIRQMIGRGRSLPGQQRGKKW